MNGRNARVLVTLSALVLLVIGSGCRKKQEPPKPRPPASKPATEAPGRATGANPAPPIAGLAVNVLPYEKPDMGAIRVRGQGMDSWSAYCDGKYFRSAATNAAIEVAPGRCDIAMAGGMRSVEVPAGRLIEIAAGTLRVDGKGIDSWSTYESGTYLRSVATNKSIELLPGDYAVTLGGGAPRPVAVVAGQETILVAGSILVSGKGIDSWSTYESGKYLRSVATNASMELLPGAYGVTLSGGAARPVTVVSGQETALGAGTLLVSGKGIDSWSAYEAGTYLRSVATNGSMELLPGAYGVTLSGGAARPATVVSGQATVLGAGTLLVSGKGIDSWSAYEAGTYLRAVATNQSIELLPGAYGVTLSGGTARAIEVVPGTESLLVAGSLRIGGDGTTSWSAYEDGHYLRSVATNATMELLPGGYEVKLRDAATPVTVVAGQEASIALD